MQQPGERREKEKRERGTKKSEAQKNYSSVAGAATVEVSGGRNSRPVTGGETLTRRFDFGGEVSRGFAFKRRDILLIILL
jgi:hypothetical protein